MVNKTKPIEGRLGEGQEFIPFVDILDKDYVLRLLDRHGYNIPAAASEAGMVEEDFENYLAENKISYKTH